MYLNNKTFINGNGAKTKVVPNNTVDMCVSYVLPPTLLCDEID